MFEHVFLAISILANILLLIPISIAFVDGWRLFMTEKKKMSPREMDELSYKVQMANGQMIAAFLKRD